VSRDQGAASTTVSAPGFAVTKSRELLLAFIATDYISGNNTTVRSVTGGGLSWDLVVRSNNQRGTAEIWRAIAASPVANVAVTATLSQRVTSSMTVMSFGGVNATDPIGATGKGSASNGAPTARVTTTKANSWVFGVGNDYDNPIARRPGEGQNLVHQYFSATGDTYWVQMRNTTTLVKGTVVTINDTAPTGDRYNLAIVEIVP
jgi:hypothetical protein